MEVKTNKKYVFKVGDQYLWDVWEEWEDVQNYSFTKQLSQAMKFYSIEGSYTAPKYLWNDEKEENCDTAQDMRDMLKGDFVSVLITETWEEV